MNDSDSLDGYHRAMLDCDLPEGEKRLVEIDGELLVLVRLEGILYCLDDVCTHDGGTLGDGELEGACLICPRHGAKFDVRTGEAVTMPATEPTRVHRVQVVDGTVYVRLCDA